MAGSTGGGSMCTGSERLERIKACALSMSACAGRLARGGGLAAEVRFAWAQAVTAAGLLGMDLATAIEGRSEGRDFLTALLDGAGMFADAAEKVDHVEDGAALAREGVKTVAVAALAEAARAGMRLEMQSGGDAGAEAFVRRVIEGFGQEADDETVRRVAADVRKAVPPFR